MTNYDFRGANVGAVGDNASAHNFVQSTWLSIAGTEADVFDLVAEVKTVLTRLAPNVTVAAFPTDVNSEAEVQDARQILSDVEAAARAGDAAQAEAALARSKPWLMRFCESVGASLTAALIKSHLGL